MKKINLLLIGLFSIMTFSLVSCSDDDEEVVIATDLVGKWQGVSRTEVTKSGDAEQEVTSNINYLGIEFTADGKYVEGRYFDEYGWNWAEWGGEDDEYYGSYTYKNRKLTVTSESGITYEINVKELTSSKLVIEYRYKEAENVSHEISDEYRRISD